MNFLLGLTIGVILGFVAAVFLLFFCFSANRREELENFLEEKDPADWWKQ